jgi:hypothetical protein
MPPDTPAYPKGIKVTDDEHQNSCFVTQSG